MTDVPRFGQRAPQARQESCTRHPGSPAVSYCKRCNRPACADCSIPTDVGSICVDCAGPAAARLRRTPWGRRTAAGRQGLGSSALPVTTTLIVINVVLGVAQLVTDQVTNWLAFNPVAGYVQPWRLVTAAFVHGGFLHLLFNMLMLYLIGTSVERTLGWWRYLSVYLLSAVAGSMGMIAWVLVSPSAIHTWTVGASGAIYGLFGAVLILQRRAGISTQSILILLGINLVYGFVMPGIAWQAHIGGFIGGMAATAAFWAVADKTRRDSPTTRTVWGLATLAVLVIVAALGTWGLYALILP